MFKHIVRSVIQNVPRMSNRSYSIYGPTNYKPPSMDDLPVPQGSWQKANDKKQASYNIQLAACLAMTVVTFIVAKTSGLIYLNWYPPTPKDKKE
ncbi:uncharacterized protein LOC124421882 [Vespa crabro]|uniref:uncharacterized protein LOC124421882 n=1 Tax=Vespa crabro TaxID=7445 RepID=UPI001F02BF76|nr:uncharacterized protein LOC124421882 [Vespa crabro]